MAPKRDCSVSLRLSADEELKLRTYASRFDMELSELVRACICIGLPVLMTAPYVRRVRMEDNINMRDMPSDL